MRIARIVQRLSTWIKRRYWIIRSSGKIHIEVSSRFGKNTDIIAKNDSTVLIGKSCVFSSGVTIEAFGQGKAIIDECVFINQRSQIVARESIRIGKKCTIGPNVMMFDHDHAIGKINKYVSAPIIVEDNVWIGAGSIV